MVRGRSDGEETKRRIAEKAKQLFVQRGYGAVTMNDVCEAAGVSKGSLYHHFPSKEELLLHVVEEDNEQWRREWEKKRATLATIEDQLFALAEHYANDIQNPLIKTMEEFARSRVMTADIVERLVRASNESSQACRDLLREGMESGELVPADLDRQVILVSSMLEGLGKLYYMVDREREQEKVGEYYREAVNLLLNGMRAER